VCVVRLSESDYRKALDVLYAAGEVEGPIACPEPVLETLRRLVPCDVVAYHEGSDQRERVIVYVGEPVGELTPEVRAAHRRFKDQDPFRPARGARTTTDFVRLRDYRRSELYQQVDRPLGIEHMLQIYLDPDGSDARLEFDRSESDFGERDRSVLHLLLPHLQQLARRTRPRGRLTRLTPREREVLGHVADGRTNAEIGWLLDVSPETVRKHLENAYAKLGVHTRTAAVAAAFGNAR
jgi:DNA-binding CsgD family transcriptional regulator